MTDSNPAGGPVNPFIIYRGRLDTYRQARAAGWSDDDYCDVVLRFDAAVAAVDGTGFEVTPVVPLETPLDRPVLAKVETGGVAGSHKARHLFGLVLQSAISTDDAATDPWAIASCGNAALAAAVVAKAAARRLQVFVPTDADPLVVAALEKLEAEVVRCPRVPGSVGDPCMERLEDAIGDGAVPFTVQGTVCPGVFDGARTLGLELAEQLQGRSEPAATDIYLQVGGGAFASSVMDGLVRGGVTTRLHPVQPLTAHPYVAAWDRLVPRLFAEVGIEDPKSPREQAAELQTFAVAGRFDDLIENAQDIMFPWPSAPSSVASGILDDITYDWRPLVHHQLRSGGWPLLPSEDDFVAATDLARRQVVPPPDATGAAGLAGALIDSPPSNESDHTAVVVLSGVDRSWKAQPQEIPTR